MVLKRLKECNLKLNTKKCKLLQTKVKYVGQIVSENSVEPDPEKKKKLDKGQNPKMLTKFVSLPYLQDIIGDL